MKSFCARCLGLLLLGLLAMQSAWAQNLALQKASLASSTVQASANAFDGNGNTRWESNSTDNEYLIVDLGSVQTIDRIRLTWENAYGKNFTLDVSGVTADPADAAWSNVVGGSWTTVQNVTNNATTNDEYSNLGSRGRYVRLQGIARATGYGYSLYELEVFNYSNNTANNLANGKQAWASSTQGTLAAGNAFDNDATTRWGSSFDDGQWVYVDLHGEGSITRLYLSWETAYGKDFRLETSEDAATWTTVSTFTGNTLHYNEVTFATPVTGRYVRMYGVTRGTGYGFSLYEFQVYGTLTPLQTAPLPVTLVAFEAAAQGSAVALSWTTASEHNSASFTVERSGNGLDFSALTSVAAAGTSASARTYHYLDAAPLGPTGYYRLRQLDRDGTATYGPVVAVAVAAADGAPAGPPVCYPNPTTGPATLAWQAATAAPARWTLQTLTGQLVRSETLASQAGANCQAIDLRACPAGTYLLTVAVAGQAPRHTRVQVQ